MEGEDGMSAPLGAGSYNGLLWGPGHKIKLVDAVGIADMPDVRASDSARSFADGEFPGQDFLGGRTITLELLLQGTDNADYHALCQLVENAFTIVRAQELPLVVFDGTRQALCRTRKRLVPQDGRWLANFGYAHVELRASDPRLYDPTSVADYSLGLALAGGGRTYNRIYPLAYGAGGLSGVQVIANTGNYPTRPTFVIHGPCTDPLVEHIEQSRRLKFNLALAATDALTVDLLNRTVTLNGTTSRRNTLSLDSAWWQLDPGDNSIRFAADAYEAGAHCDFDNVMGGYV